MPPQMKGLTQFIIDLRNSKNLEEEKKRVNLEINNIQTKFSSGSSLNGYQRKKYICKLIYIYLLGYTDEIDFGLEESFDLINSNNYSEKSLGYLSISILINYHKNLNSLNQFFDYTPSSDNSVKNHIVNLFNLVYSNLLKDLQSNNEDFNCIALQFIASNFNILNVDHLQIKNSSHTQDLFLPPQYLIHEQDEHSEKWLEIIDIIYSSLNYPNQSSLIKKKAAIAFLTLVKLYPDVILLNDNWIPRLLTVIDDSDLSVKLLAIPLIQYLTSISVKYIKSILPSISNILYDIVIENTCPSTHYYYNTPAPWLIVKLLQLVEHFFLLSDNEVPILLISDLDANTLNNLRQVVSKSIQNASQPVKGLPNRNSQSSILFQAVSLAVFLDASPDAINGATSALVMLLNSNETNTRYLALDALIKLTSRITSSSTTSKLDEHLIKIAQLLNDKDLSVRKKSLDLLYITCNPSTFNIIIPKLLDYFPVADLGIRSEIAIKIAILAEKFATDSTWYVNTMLKLLSIGGGSTGSSSGNSYSAVNYTGNEIWERIVQIIVNNEDLQVKSCRSIINLLKKPLVNRSTNSGASENLIKAASFIIGEYGHLSIDNEDTSLIIQFNLLYDAYFKVSLTTRAMLLSCFLKLTMKFPNEEFIPDILDLFEVETQSLDLEIQTRAHEFLKLTALILSNTNSNLVQSIMKPLPSFDRKESHLMNRLGSVQKLVGNRNRSSSYVVNAHSINNKNILTNSLNSNALSLSNNNSSSNISTPLMPPSSRPTINSSSSYTRSQEEFNPFEEQKAPTVPPHATILSPNWYSGYHRMLHYDAGIFFENQLIKLTYRTIKDGSTLTIKFTVINNAAKTASTDITGFTVIEFKSMTKAENPNYLINLIELPELTIKDKTSMEVQIKIRNIVETSESPIMNISFKCSGSFNQLHLKVPVALLKTLTSTNSSLDDFRQKWLQIGELLGLQQGEFKSVAHTAHRFNSSNVVRLLSRLGFAVVHSTHDTFENGILVMGAGILHTVQSKYGLLTTIKSVDDVGKEFEVLVRCTGGGVAEVVALTLKEILEGKL